jgi:hypothetical protein
MQERYANTTNQTLNICKKGMQKSLYVYVQGYAKKGIYICKKRYAKKAEPYAKVAYAKKGMQKRAHSS